MRDDFELLLSDLSIAKVLHKILDKLDVQPMLERKNSLSIAINEKEFPELFSPSSVDEDIVLEKRILTLVKLGLFTLKQSKKASFLPLVERKAKLIFNADFEEVLRVFYGREELEDAWLEALDRYDIKDKQLLELLKRNPITIKSKSEEEIVERLLEWVDEPKSKSARKESARCFWGLSKVLDKHETFKEYFGLEDMPISLLIHLQSPIIEQVLFIENQDTFYEACESEAKAFNHTVIVYASGFKASAKRIRHRRGSKMYFSVESKDIQKSFQHFQEWFYKENEANFPVYFWGDFDHAGIEILKAFKVNFENIDAWKAGYKVMVEAIKNDFGHTPIMAGKERQIKQGKKRAECAYADEVLIPLLENEIFLDQEFVEMVN